MAKVMGIINVNRESFYEGSRRLGAEDVEKAFTKMASEGAAIIDIGACSTRPGSTPVTLEQEWEYLQEPLERLAQVKSEMFCNGQEVPEISIDTFRSEIVRRACDILGPIIVNDISAGEDDPQMLSTVGNLGLSYIAMHKRGTPDTMQNLTDYPDGVVVEVKRYFEAFAEKAEKFGIEDWVLDPGFGFAKTLEQNYELLEGLDELQSLDRPILAGVSRKSMIYKLLDITPEESLPATCILNYRALQKGAAILRVHDVKEAVQTVRLFEKSLNLRG